MTRSRIEFTPLAVLPPVVDPDTGATGDSRKSTTEEQRRQAVDHALAWCADHKVWTVEVIVHWTRRSPTVLTVFGHAEHVRRGPGAEREVVPCFDRAAEAELDGRAIVTTLTEDQMTLEREVSEIYDVGLD